MNIANPRLCIALLVCAAGAVAHATDPNPATIHSDKGAWPLYRQWTPDEVRHYSKWVQNIYTVKSTGTPKQRLAKIEAVLTDPEMNLLLDPEFAGDPSNPQLDAASMHAMHTILDCGKLTVSLGSYYAYRRGLPWMITYVRSVDGTDLRTAVKNEPVTYSSSFDYTSTHQFFVDAVTGFCTGNFRVEPTAAKAEWSDTVPVAIDQAHLIPGVLYYHDGHVLILGKTDQYGQVYFLDATTAVSRDIYTHNTINAVTGLAPRKSANTANPYEGCFRGFRQYRFPIAETNADGKVLSVRRMNDEEMKAFGYNLEQYDVYEALMNGQSDQFPGHPEGIHDYIREKLRTAQSIDPIEMLDTFADQILEAFKTREQFVQTGWAEVQTNGPIPFPEGNRYQNAFNDQGRWGAFATASLDVDYRSEYFRLMSWIDDAIEWYASRPELVNCDRMPRKGMYSQADFAYVLRQEKRRIFAEKSFEYTNSKGEKIALSLQDLERRLYDMSFDPNHPPELRWGAPLNSTEWATAPESATPLPDGATLAMTEAYRREAFYRTLLHRDTDASYLRDMFTEGFPVPQKIDEHLARYFTPGSSPPLVPVEKARIQTAQR